MIIKVGILESQIITNNRRLLEELSKIYRVFDDNARFVPAYRNRHWDGYKRFLTYPGGVFSTGLLERILGTLEEVDIYPELIYDYAIDPEQLFDFNLPDWQYHTYQTDALYAALSNKREVIKAPTGAGKTLIIAGLIKALSKDRITVVLFNKKQLIDQTYKFLTEEPPNGVGIEKFGIKIGVSYSEGFKLGDVMLASVYSMSKLVGTPYEHAKVLMVDEIHEFLGGNMCSRVIQGFPLAQYRFGFTATPPSEKHQKIKRFIMEGALGPVRESISTQDLVESGMIAKPIIKMIQMPETYDLELSYLEQHNRYIVRNELRNSIIKKLCEKENEDKRVLILVKHLEHANLLLDKIPNAIKLEGKDDLLTRNKRINDFKKSKHCVLIGTNILSTGVNIKEITHFINARGLKSEIATIQALGRALRKHDRDQIKVFDFLDTQRYMKSHSESRLRTYKKESHDVEVIPHERFI